MPIVYDDRDVIDEAASSAKAKKEAQKKAKAEQKAYNKAKKESEKYDKNYQKIIKNDNRKSALNDLVNAVGSKIEGTPLGTALDYALDLTTGSNYHSEGNSDIDITPKSDQKGTKPKPGYYPSGNGLGSGSAGTAAVNDPYASLIKEINKTVQANNEWSAQQAQKQMDFQLMMSNTAHQREVTDLQAAGLNPVLSAGGSGASTASGAMAQTDTSNSRLIAEVSMEAINAVANTAAGVSRTRTKKVQAAQQATQGLLSKLGVSAASGFARSLGFAIGRGLFG